MHHGNISIQHLYTAVLTHNKGKNNIHGVYNTAVSGIVIFADTDCNCFKCHFLPDVVY